MDGHIGDAVLQCLKAAERLAELSPGVEIFDGGPEQRLHDAHGLRAQRRRAPHRSPPRSPAAPRPRCRAVRPRHSHPLETQVGGALPIDGEILDRAESRRGARYQKERQAVGIAAIPDGARGQDEHVGESRMRDHRLVAIEPEFRRPRARRASQPSGVSKRDPGSKWASAAMRSPRPWRAAARRRGVALVMPQQRGRNHGAGENRLEQQTRAAGLHQRQGLGGPNPGRRACRHVECRNAELRQSAPDGRIPTCA